MSMRQGALFQRCHSDGITEQAFHGTSDAEPPKVEEVFVIQSVIQSNPEPSIAWVMDVFHDPGAAKS